MKTYQDNNYQYFYDRNIRLWTIFKLDEKGCQVGNADYAHDKSNLKANYPKLQFIPTETKRTGTW